MSEFDTSVTAEEVRRDDDGNVTRLKTKHFAGTRYWVIIEAGPGETARITRFSPVLPDGRTPKATKKISLLDSNTVELADLEKTASLLAAAGQYARDVHDLDVKRALYLDEFRAGGRDA